MCSIDGKASPIIVVNMNGESELLMYAETAFSTVNHELKALCWADLGHLLSFASINSMYDSSTCVEVGWYMQV
jgi:hypothetical protein